MFYDGRFKGIETAGRIGHRCVHPGTLMSSMDAVETCYSPHWISVEHRLTEPICVGDMAAAAGLLPVPFYPSFLMPLLGIHPTIYAMRRKIGAFGGTGFLDGAESLLEIALDLGFESPRGFLPEHSAAFFGINPFRCPKRGVFVDPRKILHLPDKFMLDVLSRCKNCGEKPDFENEFALNIRTVAARGPRRSSGIRGRRF